MKSWSEVLWMTSLQTFGVWSPPRATGSKYWQGNKDFSRIQVFSFMHNAVYWQLMTWLILVCWIVSQCATVCRSVMQFNAVCCSFYLWGVHRHRTGWRLVGIPFTFSLQMVKVELFGCMFDVIFVQHKCMVTVLEYIQLLGKLLHYFLRSNKSNINQIPTQTVYTTQVRHHTRLVLCTCYICFAK